MEPFILEGIGPRLNGKTRVKDYKTECLGFEVGRKFEASMIKEPVYEKTISKGPT